MPRGVQATGAEIDADASQLALETYGGQIEDGDREGDQTLALCLAARALCDRLHEVAEAVRENTYASAGV